MFLHRKRKKEEFLNEIFSGFTKDKFKNGEFYLFCNLVIENFAASWLFIVEMINLSTMRKFDAHFCDNT